MFVSKLLLIILFQTCQYNFNHMLSKIKLNTFFNNFLKLTENSFIINKYKF